jgi:hypothetical protein
MLCIQLFLSRADCRLEKPDCGVVRAVDECAQVPASVIGCAVACGSQLLGHGHMHCTQKGRAVCAAEC